MSFPKHNLDDAARVLDQMLYPVQSKLPSRRPIHKFVSGRPLDRIDGLQILGYAVFYTTVTVGEDEDAKQVEIVDYKVAVARNLRHDHFLFSLAWDDMGDPRPDRFPFWNSFNVFTDAKGLRKQIASMRYERFYDRMVLTLRENNGGQLPRFDKLTPLSLKLVLVGDQPPLNLRLEPAGNPKSYQLGTTGCGASA